MGSSGGGLNAQQTATLQSMLKATKVPATTLPATLMGVGAAPTASGFSSLASDARMTMLKRQGYKATVATSPLGDAGFGTSLTKPTSPGMIGLT